MISIGGPFRASVPSVAWAAPSDARFATASDRLADLAAQDSTAAFGRRLRRYVQPRLPCIHELGYLSYDCRYADLLLEVVTRRYDAPRSIVLSTSQQAIR